MKYWLNPCLAGLLVAGLSACSDEAGQSRAEAPHWVRMASVESAKIGQVTLSGTVQARYETPIAFQVGGRIMERSFDTGQRVASGDLIFRLDPRDLEQAVRVAQAELDTALAELATAEAETRRSRDLHQGEFISDQAFEQVELAERAIRERAGAAGARLEQARNALDYASLTASRPGVLVDVIGEPGQIVSAGQTMAVIAADGPREIQVFLPETLGTPPTARLIRTDAGPIELALREVSGAADPVTRTWAARYRIVDPGASFRLGSVVRIAVDREVSDQVLQVPIGALNERGQGAQLWVIDADQARSLPAEVVSLDGEFAYVIAGLEPGDQVIALGTHLLQDGMPVRALPLD